MVPTSDALQWFGIISLGVIVIFGAAPLLRKPFDPTESVSQSWGGMPSTHRLLGIILTLFGAGFCAFLTGWLIPVYHLPTFMYGLTAVAYLALLSIAWIPITEKPGEHSLRHPHFVGGALGATGITISYMAILISQPTVPPVSRFLTIVALIYSLCWPLFFLRPARRAFLILECLFVLLFVLVICALTLGW